jgi:hypothetical protein
VNAEDGDPFEPSPQPELDDLELAALAGAILDGTPVDWKAAAATVGTRYRETFDRLRVLANLTALHRSLRPRFLLPQRHHPVRGLLSGSGTGGRSPSTNGSARERSARSFVLGTTV